MNFSFRMKVMAGALLGRDIIGDEARKQISASQLQLVSYNQPKSIDTRLEPLVKSGWRRNELIYSCVSKKANTASQVSLDVINSNTGEAIPNHPLRLLLKRPNPYMPESRFWMSVITLMDFAGNVFFEKVRSKAGRPVELWPMRPDWVYIITGSDGMVAGYEYRPSGLPGVAFSAQDIIPFNLYDPLNQYFGYPPVAVAARTGDLDNAATDYIRLIFEEGGVPPGILTTTQPINDVIAQRIRAMWIEQYGGWKNWKAPVVLGHDTKYQATGLGLQELGINLLDERSEERICSVLNVPAVLAGTRIGLERATLANVREYQKSWWDNDLIPLYKFYADILRMHLVPEFGLGIDIRWNYDEVPALQEDKNQKRQQALEAFRSGAITRNDFNREWGIDQLGPRGDVYVMQISTMEVPSKSVKPPVEKPPDTEKPAKQVNFADTPQASTGERRAVEQKMKRATIGYFSSLTRRLEEELSGKKAEAPISEEKQVNSLFWSKEYEILFNIFLPLVTEAILKSVGAAYDDLGGFARLGISWSIVHDQAMTWASLHTAEVVAQISKTSMEGFLKEFEPWLRSGEPLKVLVGNLEQWYGESRAEMIAVTETTRAFAQGNMEMWKSSGMVGGWEWVGSEDALVCPICNDEISSGVHSMEDLPPPAHPYCRCGMRPVMSENYGY